MTINSCHVLTDLLRLSFLFLTLLKEKVLTDEKRKNKAFIILKFSNQATIIVCGESHHGYLPH